MRYRVNSYTATVTQAGTAPDTLTISFGISKSVYDSLPAASSTADLKKAITESVRLIADETLGGYILCSTGQKDVVSSATKTSTTSGDTTTYALSIVFAKADLTTAADGDEDDLDAIDNLFTSAATITDQLTIEMDFGEAPEEKLGALTAAIEEIVSGFTITAVVNPPDQQHNYYQLEIDDTVKIEDGTLIIE